MPDAFAGAAGGDRGRFADHPAGHGDHTGVRGLPRRPERKPVRGGERHKVRRRALCGSGYGGRRRRRGVRGREQRSLRAGARCALGAEPAGVQLVRPPREKADGAGRHRHQRKNHRDLPPAAYPAAHGAKDRPHRHGGESRGRAGFSCAAHHAGCLAAAAAACADGRGPAAPMR